MQFGLTQTQQVLKNSAREFLTAECPMAEVRRLMETPSAHDAAFWRKMAHQGWTGIVFDEEYGGLGLGLIEMAVALEEMGRALLPGPYLSTVLLAGTVIDAAAQPDQKHKYLAPIAQGQACATLALLEESASWEPDAVQLAARAVQADFVLNGSKMFVPDAAAATYLVCAARLGAELALFVVPRHARGLTVSPLPAIDDTRKLYQVTFENVAVPAAGCLATGPAARAALERALSVATVALVAEMVGGMQRIMEIAVEYAKTRKQFGKPIGQFQAVQHLCADMLLLTESSRSAAYYAAWALEERVPEAQVAVSIGKAYASDAYREIGNRGIQVQGGMGFTWENNVHLYYRRAKASELMFGDAAYHRERIARAAIDNSQNL